MNQIKHLIISFLTTILIMAVAFTMSFAIAMVTKAIGTSSMVFSVAFIILWAFVYKTAKNM
jgi:hypothetical protein